MRSSPLHAEVDSGQYRGLGGSRPVHIAHGLPCPPASGARAHVGLPSYLADVHVLAAEAEALPVAAGEDGEVDGDVLAGGEEDVLAGG